MKKKIFNVLFAMVLGVSFSLMAAPAIASSVTFTINESPSPVFSTLIPDQAYVIKDNVNYKLYYAGNNFASINLAQSPDGITWTPYSGNPIISDAQYHADVKYYSTGFTGANSGTDPSSLTMYYRMWYAGLNQNSISGWRYAESPDGINWFNHIPVTQFGPPVYSAATGVTYGIADVVYTPGASNTGTDWTFRIYANVQWELGAYGGKELVVMAFSSDGYNWTGYDPTAAGYATPVFAGTLVTSDFDCDHIGWFKVIKNSPTDWEAFYSGGKETTYQALNGIGYATSTDGINWTRSQTLFTTSDGVAWRSQSVWMPSVVKTGSNYQIWFLGSDNPNLDSSNWIQWKLGMANLTVAPTPTPCDWVEYGNNPVFGQGLPGGGAMAYYPKVIYDANQFSGHGNTAYYKMWFGSDDGTGTRQIGYAESADGINWTAGPNPVFGLVTGANHPLVKYRPDGFGNGIFYKMWYEDTAYLYSINALRYAESTDGVNWTNDQALTQDGTYPLVTNSWPDWNTGSYGPCDLIYNSSGFPDDINIWNNKYVIYYMGTDGTNEAIGLAYSADGTHWKRYVNNPVLSPGTALDWDNTGVGYCSVLNLSGNWQMWYGGGVETNHGIGYATSTDGINWTKHPGNPIFYKDDGMPWRNDRTYTPWVLYDAANFGGDTCPYKMWFSGKSSTGKYSVGYACATPVDAGPNQDVCEGGDPIALIGASPSGGTWSGTGVSGSDFNPTGLLPGPYIVTYSYTNAKGCSSSNNKTVTINTRPIVNAGPDLTIISGSSTVIGGSPTASGGIPPYTYSWVPATDLNNPASANPTASPNTNTTYTVTVTDSKGCTSIDSMTLSVQLPTPQPLIGGSGGGGLPASLVACPATLAVDMQGTTTMASMTGKGVLCETCIAKDASGKYVLELDKDTKLVLAGDRVPLLLRFRESSAPPPAPENTTIVGPVYEISAYPTSYATVPSPVTILPPATLTLTYDPKKLPTNATEVFIANFDAAQGWQALAPVPGVVAELGKAQGLASHFSPVAVLARLAEPKPAEFEVSNLTVNPSHAQPNQEVTVSIKVTNTGEKSGDYSLQLKVDGVITSTKQVTAAAGTSQTVNFTTAGYAAGKHQVEVAGLSGEFEILKVSQPTNTNWWFIVGVTAIIMLIVALLIALRR
ncbi:MAG: CARDB domain-containing protein [Dehalococcoidia bacterium]